MLHQRPLRVGVRRERRADLVHGEQTGVVLQPDGQHRRRSAVLSRPGDGLRTPLVPPAQALLGPGAEGAHVKGLLCRQQPAAGLLPPPPARNRRALPAGERLAAGGGRVRAKVRGKDQHAGDHPVLLRAHRLLPGGAVHVHRAPAHQQREGGRSFGGRPEEDAEEAAGVHAGLLRQLVAVERVRDAGGERPRPLVLAQLVRAGPHHHRRLRHRHVFELAAEAVSVFHKS